MCGVYTNGYDMAAQLTYIGKILFGGGLIPHGLDPMARNGNSPCSVLDLSHGGGYPCGTKAQLKRQEDGINELARKNEIRVF